MNVSIKCNKHKLILLSYITSIYEIEFDVCLYTVQYEYYLHIHIAHVNAINAKI